MLTKLGGKKKERIQSLRGSLISNSPGICPERARYYTKTYQEHEKTPPILKRAFALKEYLQHVSLAMGEGELIPGWQSSHPRWTPIFPEYSWQWVYDELDRFNQRTYDRFNISEESIAELRQLLPWWQGQSLLEHVMARQPQFVLDASRLGAISWTGQATSGEGHIIVDHAMALEFGLPTLREKAQKLSDLIKEEDVDYQEKHDFYQAVTIAYDGVLAYIERLAKLMVTEVARAQADREEELIGVSKDLRALLDGAPQTFRQALYLVWLIHLIQQMESNGHSASLGRLDQYLFSFYKRDLQSGMITEEDALELLEHFYLKIFSIIKLRSEGHSRTQTGYPTYQNICVGGQTKDGKDGVNPLSWLCLSALAEIRLSEPNFYVRVYPGTPADFLDAALQVVRMGFGMPAFVNDEIIIPALERVGVSHADAINYSSMGCVEVQVPGKWGYRANGKSKLNVLKVLELALNKGCDPKTGINLRPGKRNLEEMEKFEEVLSAWRTQLAFYTETHVTADNIIDQTLEEMVPNVVCSSLVQDCLGRGKQLNSGGAIYDTTGGCQVGFPNVGNSLAALHELVFDKKVLTSVELKSALQSNFNGQRGEEIRQMLINRVPRYGEDESLPDELTTLALEDYCQLIENYHNLRHGRGPIGGGYSASTNTVSANITAGEVVGATPDGRMSGEPTADGISPAQGNGRKGPTAIFHSVSKMPTVKITGGQLLNMRINPLTISSPESLKKLAALIRGFFRLKGWHVQFNTMSTKTLRDAIEHPHKYPDLIVRVAGYSALFVALDPALQRDIIARMEQQVG